MTDLRANILVHCAACSRPVEVLLGLPAVDDGADSLHARQVCVQAGAMDDHLRASPSCVMDGRVYFQGYLAEPEFYASFKAHVRVGVRGLVP